MPELLTAPILISIIAIVKELLKPKEEEDRGKLTGTIKKINLKIKPRKK